MLAADHKFRTTSNAMIICGTLSTSGRKITVPE